MPSIKDKLFEMVSGFFHNQIDFSELTYGLCILLIFIANYRTNLYKQYADLNMRRKSAGLKSL